MTEQVVEWGSLTETERIEQWREDYALRYCNCTPDQAAYVRKHKFDIHELEALVSAGCAVDLALDILTNGRA